MEPRLANVQNTIQTLSGIFRGHLSRFDSVLEGLARFEKASKPFQNYLLTDGVSVSLVMRTSLDGKKLRKRHRKADEQSFPAPLPGQRVVGIDPGRRDMIALVSNGEEDLPFTISTKSMEVETGGHQSEPEGPRRPCCSLPDFSGTFLTFRDGATARRANSLRIV